MYMAGDLLLNLLEDLLSFSKNQISHQVCLERREFRLSEIKSQIVAIFDKQVRENRVDFSVDFMHFTNFGTPEMPRRSLDGHLPALGPPGMGRLKDVYVYGDMHRILQVIINLVGNSVKFTPAGGRVQLRIRCLGETEQDHSDNASRMSSSLSRSPSVAAGGLTRIRGNSSSIHSNSSAIVAAVKDGTALEINPMEPKTALHIAARERSVSPPPANLKSFMFEFEVEDSGHGIPEHMQAKIFEPFVQGDSGLNKKFGGTGLGLSICAQLVKLMGGSITLKSSVDKGSIFTMHIPLDYVKDRTPSTASSSIRSRAGSLASNPDETQRTSLTSTATANGTTIGSSDQKHGGGGINGGSNSNSSGNPNHHILENKPRLVGLSAPFFTSSASPHSETDKSYSSRQTNGASSKLKVLVADDNTTNIEVVSRMLKLEDVYDVTVAKDGQEAYELVKASMTQHKQQQFDVIFMDVQMPNVNGLESTRLIRKMGYEAPIVALTAFSEESNVQECIASGMNEFLSKPIRRPALKKVLTKIFTIEEEDVTASASQSQTSLPGPPTPTHDGTPPPTPPTTGGDEENTKSELRVLDEPTPRLLDEKTNGV